MEGLTATHQYNEQYETWWVAQAKAEIGPWKRGNRKRGGGAVRQHIHNGSVRHFPRYVA